MLDARVLLITSTKWRKIRVHDLTLKGMHSNTDEIIEQKLFMNLHRKDYTFIFLRKNGA